jgi:hypothetical protein
MVHAARIPTGWWCVTNLDVLDTRLHVRVLVLSQRLQIPLVHAHPHPALPEQRAHSLQSEAKQRISTWLTHQTVTTHFHISCRSFNSLEE